MYQNFQNNVCGFFYILRAYIFDIRKKLWAYPCGFLICGAVTYMCIHGCIAMMKGTLPHDLATILIFLPYLLAAPVGVFLLYRDLRQSFEVSG